MPFSRARCPRSRAGFIASLEVAFRLRAVRADTAIVDERITSVDSMLQEAVERRASDLHLAVGARPAIRIRGHLVLLDDVPPLDADSLRTLLYGILTTEQQKRLELDRQIDLTYAIPGLARFRLNVFLEREALAAAFRVVPHELKTLEELGMDSLVELTALPRGLIVVTGPTGSGKSTTLAAMIDEINRTRPDHIITIEDPIEFLHRHKHCIVNQREIGTDAESFSAALRAALRQDPDVILVGEMRDLETISTALTAAETGHLVFGTLHTQSASGTIDRIIDVFPAAQQDQVRAQLAGSLQGVVTQALLPTADGQGRVAALEVLIPDDAIRNLIRQAKVEQIYSYMQTGSRGGMQTLEQSLAELVLHRIVASDEAISRSSRREELIALLNRLGAGTVQAVTPPTGELRLARTGV
jgi:twitching motility protein PilT